MRILFAGTPEAAVPSLDALGARHDIIGVVTRPDAPLGRRRTLTPSPVAARAAELGLEVIRSARIDDAVTQRIRELAPELAVVVAYGAIVREPALSLPAHGWINLHFSLLPAWRGAAPVQRALIAGARETGVTVFRLVPELDAGPILAQQSYPIGRHQTAGDLLRALAEIGAGVLAEAVAAIEQGTAEFVEQAGAVTFAPKLTVEDGRLDWHAPAEELLARIRGVTPEPGAHTLLDGRRFKISAAALAHDGPDLAPGEVRAVGRGVQVGTGSGALELLRVQPFGRPAMDAAAWLRGRTGATVFDEEGS